MTRRLTNLTDEVIRAVALMREASKAILKLRKTNDIITGAHICARLSDAADALEAASTELGW